MTVLDGDIGDVIRCDRCKSITDYDNSGYQIRSELWKGEIFRSIDSRFKFDFFDYDFCLVCTEKLTPTVYKLFDICDLKTHLYTLEKEIRKCKQKSKQQAI